jgi:predicted GIY-YIG superfamily endonuclease
MGGSYFVYILASRRNGTLYIGVTNDLVRRMSEHKGKSLAQGRSLHSPGTLSTC